MLNLAYIPEYVTEKFRFETGFYKNFLPAMNSYRIGQQRLLKMAGKDLKNVIMPKSKPGSGV